MSASLILGLVFFSSNLMAQARSIKGVVIESTTEKPLEGVRVSIQNAGETISDKNGIYVISNVPYGEQTLIVDLLGYSPKSVQVLVESDDQSMDEIKLVDAFSDGDGDRILVEERKQQQAGSLTRQSESVNFNTVLSTQQMEAFGDMTLQDAISRFPGVHVGLEGDVNIRGVGYNQFNVTLNGRQMASTGLGDRNVDLAGISVDMLHQLEIIRVVTPDMHADALAGVVNIRTRRPAGDRAINAYGGIGAQPAYFTYGGMGARGGVHYTEAIREDLSFGLNLNYQQDYFGWETLNLDHDVAELGGDQTDVIRRVSPGLHDNRNGRFSGSLQLDYMPSEQMLVYINGFYNNDNRIMDLHRNYWDTGGDWILPDTTGAQGSQGSYGSDMRSRVHDVQYYAIQTGARHWFDYFDFEYNVNWSYAQAQQEQYLFQFMIDGLDFAIDHQSPTRPAMTPTNIILRRDGTIDYRMISMEGIERTVNDHKDHTFSGNIDLDIPFGNAALKFGSSALLNYKKGKFTQTPFTYFRPLNLSRYRMVPQGHINIFDEEAYLIPWIMESDRARLFFEENTPHFIKDEEQERKNSDIWNYDHSESILAGYGMGTMRLGNVHLKGGVRIEHTIANYEGREVDFDEDDQWVASNIVDADRQYTHLFPNAQIAYEFSDVSNIRLAWSRTIARPDYNRLSPYTLTLRQDATLLRGNPDLDPMISDNLDLLVDHYFNGIGQIGIGVFYKRLSDFVFERSRLVTEGEFAGYNERFFDNGEEQATLYGVEVFWQQNLTFLPGILGNFGTYANYTWSESEFEVDHRPNEKVRLPGQSPHILNAALNYSQGRIFSQISYYWMAETLIGLAESTTLAPSISGTEQVYLDRYDSGISDLSVSFAFHISENFRFWADASNLLQNERVIYDHSKSVYPVNTNLLQGLVFRSGIQFNL